MRIWDVSPKKLCDRHLFGEHCELHGIWSILTNNKKGYRNHPETKRWVGKNKALYLRHEKLVREMRKRGYCHNSAIDKEQVSGKAKQNKFVNTMTEQRMILKLKNCDCPL